MVAIGRRGAMLGGIGTLALGATVPAIGQDITFFRIGTGQRGEDCQELAHLGGEHSGKSVVEGLGQSAIEVVDAGQRSLLAGR